VKITLNAPLDFVSNSIDRDRRPRGFNVLFAGEAPLLGKQTVTFFP
jgi:hypothetical protein